MSSITLYTFDASPPCRTVYMVAKALGVKVKRQIVDTLKQEQLNPDFLKLNPKHTVPTLVDGDLILIDSHAITAYLVGKYGENDDLYPNDVTQKALIDQMLHFDSNVIFVVLEDIAKPLLRQSHKEIADEKIEKAKNIYSFLDKFLEGKDWVAIDRPTIADLHLIATVMTLDILVPYAGYSNIENWVGRCKKLSCYSENLKGYEDARNLFEGLLKK